MDAENILKHLSGLIKEVFNPLGIPGAIYPPYQDFIMGPHNVSKRNYHEAGHETVNYFLQYGSKTILLCINSSPVFLKNWQGYRLCKIKVNDDNLVEHFIRAEIVMAMGGIAAEELKFGKADVVRKRKNDDISQATNLTSSPNNLAKREFSIQTISQKL